MMELVSTGKPTVIQSLYDHRYLGVKRLVSAEEYGTKDVQEFQRPMDDRLGNIASSTQADRPKN